MAARSDDPGRGRSRARKGGRNSRKRTKASKATRTRTRASATTRPDAVAAAWADASADGRGHTGFELSNEAIETALLTGEFAGPLEDYFGPTAFQELRQLQREAASRGVRGGPRVLILPGIMGSKIGRKGTLPLFDNVLWLDPVSIAAGRLSEISMIGKKKELRPLGVILLYYLRLKLRLRSAGYDADFHPFDWRLSIADLGKQLAERIRREKGEVSLVAHSMGGLVSRYALGKAGGAKCKRLIMLGTPNFGSYAPVMALRAAYPVVRKVGGLDLKHTPEELARDVFSTFPGLTQMFPARPRLGDVDVYDLDEWPDDDLRPRQELLDSVEKVYGEMIDGGDNVFLIAGIDQETPTGVRVVEEEQNGKKTRAFAFEFSTAGDGTVPLDLCRLPGAHKTYYVAEQHGAMANSKRIAEAVLDLLDRGETSKLPDVYNPPASRAAARARHERELRVDPYEGRRGGLLSQREVRHLLDEFVSPDARDAAAAVVPSVAPRTAAAAPASAPELGYRHRFERVVVGRRRQHRIDLRFAFGSITESDARALALGIFQNVAPAGAASALDARLNGAITDLTRRRMFSGNVGEIFMLPTGRHGLRSELIAFVGLGPFDRFNDEVLQTAAENVIRTFINTRVEEFATVLFGGGSGENPANGLRNLLIGFFRGLRDADADHQFRRLVVCENNADRYVQLKEELYRLSSTALCQDVEITFDETQLPAALEAPALPRRLQRREDPIYLIVRQEASTKTQFDVRSSLLTTGSKATVITGVRAVVNDKFDDVLARTVSDRTDEFSGVGAELGELLLAAEVRSVMPRFRKDNHLIVVHDAPLSRVPWETIALPAEDGKSTVWFPAAERGLSHRYAAENLSIAKWLEQRIGDDVLNILLVVDPTRDLQGARVEGKRVQDLFRNRPGCVVDQLFQSDATRPALLTAFGSGKYDIIHYAGHAFFDPMKSERSGILCHNEVPLTGADLAGLGNLPTLVFFNACESARVRALPATRRRSKDEQTRIKRERLAQLSKSVGLAEAFMRGGVANFIGTYWPVSDAAAEIFAREFYSAILNGDTIGSALQISRGKVLEQKSRDWANYIFYGNPDFVLKDVEPGLRGGPHEILVDVGEDMKEAEAVAAS